MSASKPTSFSSRFAIALTGAILIIAGTSSAALAEFTISGYLGANFSPHSDVDYDFNNGTSGSQTVEWDGESFEMPPFYGVRAAWWIEEIPQFGIALDFTHAKVSADLKPPFSTLEFTDGINFVTLNAMYRFDLGNNWTPYIGAGIGATIPHVEVDDGPGGAPETFEYQVTGIAAQALVGIDYKLTENWSVFGELKSTYGVVDAKLKGGGSLETDIISNQVIVGLTYKLF